MDILYRANRGNSHMLFIINGVFLMQIKKEAGILEIIPAENGILVKGAGGSSDMHVFSSLADMFEFIGEYYVGPVVRLSDFGVDADDVKSNMEAGRRKAK